MRIVIADDELPARLRLANMLREHALGEVVGEARNGVEALDITAKAVPDVLLLDIRMPGMDGIEVARHLVRLRHPPAVIFTTAYDSHALEAFEVNAVDYLLKPIRRERLLEAIGRARRLSRRQVDNLEAQQPGARSHVSATLHGTVRLVPVAEVRYFLADQKYTSAGYPAGEVLIEDPLKDLEHEFADLFARVHRNALVALRYVRTLDRDGNGHYRVRLEGVPREVAVSRRELAAFRRRLLG